MLLRYSVGKLLILGLLLISVRADSDEDEETSDEGSLKSLLSPTSWMKGRNSIVVPILSRGGEDPAPDPPAAAVPSILEQASSSIFGLASEGLNHFSNGTKDVLNDMTSYVKNIPENVPGKDAIRIIGNTVTNFHDVAFPDENTTFIDGMTNLVKEVQATKNELDSWPLQEVIKKGIMDQASNLFKFPTTTTTNTPSPSRLNEVTTQGQTQSMATSSEHTWLIVIAIVTGISLLINLMLGYYLMQHKSKLKRIKAEVRMSNLEKNQVLEEQQKTLLKQQQDV